MKRYLSNSKAKEFSTVSLLEFEKFVVCCYCAAAETFLEIRHLASHTLTYIQKYMTYVSKLRDF